MAIYKNRINHRNHLKFFRYLIIFLFQRFKIFLYFISITILIYLAPIQLFSDLKLEIYGKTVHCVNEIFNVMTYPVNFVAQKLKLLEDLEEQNNKLKIKLAELDTLQTKYEMLRIENGALREILNVVPDKEFEVTKARLLGVSLNPFNKTLLIGAGRVHGISENQIVTSEDALIGRIVQTNDNYAEVMLINDINSRIPVITSGSGERAILSAENNKLILLYLQNNHKVSQGEIILTSGDGKLYPHGLPVARVREVHSNKIEIDPIASLSRIEFVNILH